MRSVNLGRFFAAVALASGLVGIALTRPALAQQASPQKARQKAQTAQISPDRLWKQADPALLLPDSATNALTSRLTFYRAYQADMNAILTALKQAPMEFTMDIRQSPLIVTLPMPDGTFARFSLLESPIVSNQIAADHPEIKTYIGQGIDDPCATARIDHTPDGFHAMILSPNGQVFVSPYVRGDQARYISYFKTDMMPDPAGFKCETLSGAEEASDPASHPFAQPFASVGTTLRQYRLALSCTAEYAAVFGGTTAGAMNAMVTTMNRVDGVYEKEVAVRMTIVKFNIYTNVAGEPFSNGNGSAMLSQNETVCDGANAAQTGPGTGGYDIGHVFSTGGGGVASLGVICNSLRKAGGVTGSPSPRGDGFDIDYVAHEMGHQFGGNHSFNGTSGSCGGNRASSAAYEPGSGSTIMAYAGICSPEDLQPHSDAYFHTKNFDEIVAYISGSGNGCSVRTTTGNNPPVVSPGANYTIPQSTPFLLTASGTDPEGDALTYCWEEFDLGSATPPTNTGAGVPLFRSFNPTVSPSRAFPNLPALLSNTATPWEVLPTMNRTLNFRVTARDNKAGGGGVNYAAAQVTVSGSAFALSNRTTAFTWNGGTAQTVTWTVGGGSVASKVNLLFSSDGGNTFTTLAAGVPNTGSATVTAPTTPTTKARLRIEAVGNIFFDVSRVNFTVTYTPPPPRHLRDADVRGNRRRRARAECDVHFPAIGRRVFHADGLGSGKRRVQYHGNPERCVQRLDQGR